MHMQMHLLNGKNKFFCVRCVVKEHKTVSVCLCVLFIIMFALSAFLPICADTAEETVTVDITLLICLIGGAVIAVACVCVIIGVKLWRKRKK